MHIIIDGKNVVFTKNDKNIVEVADKAGIGISAPCYRSGQKSSCCMACVIEIDGEQAYACSTKPNNGMNIILNRNDLISLRKNRLKKYSENPGQGCNCGCTCESNTTNEVSCC